MYVYTHWKFNIENLSSLPTLIFQGLGRIVVWRQRPRWKNYQTQLVSACSYPSRISLAPQKSALKPLFFKINHVYYGKFPIFPNSIAGFKKYPNGNGRWIPACANGSSRGDLQQHHARCKVAGISPQGRGGWSVGFAFVV